MATRRVRRIKRAGSKKRQSHHGRKTKHHHKRNHNRITRRHQGGMQAILGAVKLFTGSKLNEKGTTESPTPFDGIEVNYFKKYNTFHLGNGRYELIDYLSDRSKMEYGEKIQAALNRTNAKIRALSKINQEEVGGIISDEKMNELELTPGQFVYFAAATKSDHRRQELFDRLYPAEAEPPKEEPRTAFALKIVGKSMTLFFQKKPHTLSLGSSTEVDIPPELNSDQNPVFKLIFTPGPGVKLTVKYVLKRDAMSYCAMTRYANENQHDLSIHTTGEFDYTIPCITKYLDITSATETSGDTRVNYQLDSQILPIIKSIATYANDCANDKDRFAHARKQYEDLDMPATLKSNILALFPQVLPEEKIDPALQAKMDARKARSFLTSSIRRLESATKLIAAQPDSVLSPTEKEPLNGRIEYYKTQLSANGSNIAELNRLDNEIILFGTVEIPTLLIQAKKAAAMRPSSPGMDALAGRMSGLLTPMDGPPPSAPPSASSSASANDL